MLEGAKTVEVAAAADAVFAVLADVERYPEWQSFVRSLAVRERDGEDRPHVVEAEFDAKVTSFRVTLACAYDPGPPARVEWRRRSGDVKDLTGAYDIEAIDAGRCRVSYAVVVDPGFRLGLLIRGPVEERVRARVVDGTLEELQRRVAGPA